LVDDLDAPLEAAAHMAADVAMAERVAGGGLPALRLYRWTAPALSLGRFQPEADVDLPACRARGVEVVRRPTGGRALLHGGDLTYAVAMPRPSGPDGTVDAVYCLLARGLVEGLRLLGVEAAVASAEGTAGPACFAAVRGSDLRVGDRKVCGSAQVHRAGDSGVTVLQHGSILLERLSFDECDVLRYPSEEARAAERARLRTGTVTLHELGVRSSVAEVAAAVASGFARALDLQFTSREVVAAGEGHR
jgi:lipoate-protein ligase A